MKFSNAEKLELLLLCDIADGKKEIDPDFIREAIYTNNTWGIAWKYNGYEFEEEKPAHVSNVLDVLSMYTTLKFSYDELSSEDKAIVDSSKSADWLKYRGFDGNNESRYLSAVNFLVINLDRFSDIGITPRLNSHTPALPKYMAMHAVWKSFDTANLTATQIVQIIEA